MSSPLVPYKHGKITFYYTPLTGEDRVIADSLSPDDADTQDEDLLTHLINRRTVMFVESCGEEPLVVAWPPHPTDQVALLKHLGRDIVWSYGRSILGITAQPLD